MTTPGGWITPNWTLQPGIRAFTTNRQGGVSAGAYHSFNLARHVGDDADRVASNRVRLQAISGCRSIQWLNQVHGVEVVRARSGFAAPVPGTAVSGMAVPGMAAPEADALWTDEPGVGIAVLTADCLPVVVAARSGEAIAVAHGGWRGLVAGVLQATLNRLPCASSDCVAWLGPAIGPRSYEVGEDVAGAVADLGVVAEGCLSPGKVPGKYWLDLFMLARRQLLQAGVSEVFSQQICTYESPLLYSYRRDGLTGRMATLAWLQPAD